jgi:6-phospho-beta-glucosidase
MKIAIIGAAGVRTPLLVHSIFKRQERLGISELSLMDIDAERLELIGALTTQLERSARKKIKIQRTTDPYAALDHSDFVITTFRVGGIESRVTDERVPLNHGILGQETTGPGGFAMGMRSIPVLLDYVTLMQKLCPEAWLINFANPAGMLTEAVIRNSAWRRVVGICDAPSSMQRAISAVLGADPGELDIEYFGLNHLGWIKNVGFQLHERLPDLIEIIRRMGNVPGLPFEVDLITSLGMIPNEYLYYYYYAQQAVNHILSAGECRGEQIARENLVLFSTLKEKFSRQDFDGMVAAFQLYIDQRSATYMTRETGRSNDFSALDPKYLHAISSDEGYAGVALDLIEALTGNRNGMLILNVPNNNSIDFMQEKDVVEIPSMVSRNKIQPRPIGLLPDHCLGLILQVKHYEHLTIEAAVEQSYQKARLALTAHPLVRDYELAGIILDEYITRQKGYFPNLH